MSIVNKAVVKYLAIFAFMSVCCDLWAHDEFIEVISLSKPAVVTVEAIRKKKLFGSSKAKQRKKALGSYADFFDEMQGDSEKDVPAKRHGSGFVVSANGEILTAAHVVRGASKLWIRFANGERKLAKLVRYDSRLDVALLVVDQAPQLEDVLKLSSEQVQEGQSVLAIGAAFGLPISSSVGIVSSVGVTLPGNSGKGLIQTDATINPGSSGGPLLNSKGEVVGLVAKIYSKTGTFSGSAFAVPSQQLIEFLSLR